MDTVPGLRSARAVGVGATLAVTTSTPGDELAPYADLLVANLAEVALGVADGRVRLRGAPPTGYVHRER